MSLEIVGAVIAVLTFLGGILAWWSANVEKQYAAKRDFEHLKRNYEQIAQTLKVIHEDMDDRFDFMERESADVRQKLNVIMIKILPEHSTGWMKQQDTDKGG